MADANAEAAAAPTDYVRVKRKRTTIFLYIDPKLDTVHDLRARINHITKVPTTDVRFFIDKDGEVPIDENKSLGDQSVRAAPRRPARSATRAPLDAHGSRRSRESEVWVLLICAACAGVRRGRTRGSCSRRLAPAPSQIQNDDVLYMVYRKEGSDEWEEIELATEGAAPKAEGA